MFHKLVAHSTEIEYKDYRRTAIEETKKGFE